MNFTNYFLLKVSKPFVCFRVLGIYFKIKKVKITIIFTPSGTVNKVLFGVKVVKSGSSEIVIGKIGNKKDYLETVLYPIEKIFLEKDCMKEDIVKIGF